MSRYDILFEPVKIGPVTTPNRFYAVPHATGHGWSQPNGAIALRATKAQGGWGVVAAQMQEVSPDSDLANHPMDRIWDDSDMAAHAAQVQAIKFHGALAAIELAHGGMRSRNLTTGLPVRGPSHLPILRPELPIQARAMNKEDIENFRQSHLAAAGRAIAAGYDILYVYAAHDLSLLSHFLSRRTNHRSDHYGGSLNNRMRLLREVLEDTLELANRNNKAVALRFSVAEPDKAIGLTHNGEGREVVEALAELPDLWDVNISGWPQDSATSRFTEEGYQLGFTDFVKSVTTKPVVGVGRFTSPDLMVSMVKNGQLDLIGAARPSIADPFLPLKIKQDRLEDIRECIGCNICVSMDGYGVPLRCTQNPTIAEEWRRNWHPEHIPPSSRKQSHLIIGAGPAGLECAWTLLRAGHKVTIADAADFAGGRVTREASLPGLNAWIRVRDYRKAQIQKSNLAELYLSSEMTVNDLCEFNADHIVIATGSHWRADGIGSSSMQKIDFNTNTVLTPDDIMNGYIFDEQNTGIVVYDDDHFYMASVIAEKLATSGHNITYVTSAPAVASWTDYTLEQDRIIQHMNELGIGIKVNTALAQSGEFKCTLTGQPIIIDHTAIVMVGAKSPDEALYLSASADPRLKNIHIAGDSQSPGIIQAAVLSGHTCARKILSGSSAALPFKRESSIVVSQDQHL